MSVAELTVEEELAYIREVAESRAWLLVVKSPIEFLLGFHASDGTLYYLTVLCDEYPVKPPAWHWCDADGAGRENRVNAPKGSDFLHPNGVVCAPWNRLSYRVIDARGPHEEWTLGDWRNNSYTKGCKTLCAMALRIQVELNGPHFHKARLAA